MNIAKNFKNTYFEEHLRTAASIEHMKQQGSKRGTTGTSLRKMILAHPESFQYVSI